MTWGGPGRVAFADVGKAQNILRRAILKIHHRSVWSDAMEADFQRMQSGLEPKAGRLKPLYSRALRLDAVQTRTVLVDAGYRVDAWGLFHIAQELGTTGPALALFCNPGIGKPSRIPLLDYSFVLWFHKYFDDEPVVEDGA